MLACSGYFNPVISQFTVKKRDLNYKMTTNKRPYLSSRERQALILHAAFEEFSKRGFLATSMERIASRAKLSKSGIYAHFKSKNEIFKEMLLTVLLPPMDYVIPIQKKADDSLANLVEKYLERRYTILSTDKAIAAFRLLIVESARIPDLVRQCVERLLERGLSNDIKFLTTLNKGADHKKQSNLPNIALEDYLLANSPTSLWLSQIAIFGAENPPVPLDKVKALHKEYLLKLLESV